MTERLSDERLQEAIRLATERRIALTYSELCAALTELQERRAAERAPQDVEAAWREWVGSRGVRAESADPQERVLSIALETAFLAGWEAHAAATDGAVALTLTAKEAAALADIVRPEEFYPGRTWDGLHAKLRAALDALGRAE